MFRLLQAAPAIQRVALLSVGQQNQRQIGHGELEEPLLVARLRALADLCRELNVENTLPKAWSLGPVEGRGSMGWQLDRKDFEGRL